ncbi:hypothetical protein GCM10008934_07150 [Virgibacillus salarius]
MEDIKISEVLMIKSIGLVGVPYAMKVARTVLTGGKGSDNVKPLPICITTNTMPESGHFVEQNMV